MIPCFALSLFVLCFYANIHIFFLSPSQNRFFYIKRREILANIVILQHIISPRGTHPNRKTDMKKHILNIITTACFIAAGWGSTACRQRSQTTSGDASGITLEHLSGTWTARTWRSNGEEKSSDTGLKLIIREDSTAAFCGCDYSQIKGRIRIKDNALVISNKQQGLKFIITRLSTRTLELNYWRTKYTGVDIFTLTKEEE